MKKRLLLKLLFIGILAASYGTAKAQNLVLNLSFDGYMGTEATVPAGFYFSWNSNTSNSFYTSVGNYGIASPSYKFGNDGDFIVTPAVSAIDSLTFWSKGNGAPFSPLNELRIYHSIDSVNWILDNTIVPLSASGNTMSVSLSQTSGYFKFEYFKSAGGGNLAFDDLKLYSAVPVSLTENIREELISVYPSPTTGLLNIRLQNSTSSNITAEVFDMLGNKINGLVVERKNKGHYTIDLSGKNKGFYFIKIQTSTQFITRRVTLTY